MLGLRKNPLSRRNRNSFISIGSRRSSTDTTATDPAAAVDSSSAAEKSAPSTPAPASPAPRTPEPSASAQSTPAKEPQMDLLRQQNGSATPTSEKHETTVSVKDVQLSDEEKNSREQRTTTTSSSNQSSRVIESGRTLKRRMVFGIDDLDEAFFERVSLEQFLDFIADERLIHMPHKGSQWDRILKSAEYFALELYSFAQAVSPFVAESKNASFLAIGFCRLLLELGHHQSQALEPTFDILYDFGALISHTLQRRELFHSDEQVKEDLTEIFAGLVSLVGDIALYYRQRISKMTTESVSIDFNGAFGKSTDRIWARREHLSNHLWSFKLRRKHLPLTVEALRHKLSPIEQSARTLLYGRLADKAERASGTCEWIQHHMLDFFRGSDHIFTITGASGCGKSMLAGWMKDRLQRPLGRKSYETISFSFADDAPAETRPLALLKSLLHQLLERNIGDSHLYEKLVHAFETHSEQNSPAKLETALWEALGAGLKTIEEGKCNMVLIVDGLDEVRGNESPAQLHKKLHNCVQKFSGVKAITLSRPISHLGGADTRHLVITPEQTHEDIAAYLQQALGQYQYFNSQNANTRSEFVNDLAKKAKGSFLWAYLLVKLLGSENSYENFHKAGHSAPQDVHGMLQKHLELVDLKETHTRHMFAFMLVAERPLTLSEMGDLLAINTHKKTVTAHISIEQHVAKTCSSLVVDRKGLLRFKHSEIRRFFKEELCGKALPSIKESHSEFVKRSLCYAKICLTSSQEPTFDVLSDEIITNTFKTHVLLEYIVRTWIHHFRHSSYVGTKDELHISHEFKQDFPDSTLFAMIEWACWQNQIAHSEAIEHHDLALRIRTACFGEKHLSVMQNVIILATFYRSASETTKASEYFYHASVIGQAVLYRFSAVVVSCTTIFLTLTETITITKRTELVTHREEMIRFMIEICKRKHGESSDVVIKWYEALAKLYVDLKEESRATVIYRELHQILVLRFGRSHPRTKGVSGTLGDLTVVLHDDDDKEVDVEESHSLLFETADEVEETSEMRISLMLRLAKTYEKKKQWVHAEKIYVNLWRRICEISRTGTNTEMHITKVNIALEYVRFLQRMKRTEEASSILVCLWAEYEHQKFESETMMLRIKEIGTLFKAFGLLTVAVSVFGKVWGWFKAKGKADHAEAVSTTVLITEVVEEITETTTLTKRTTTTTTNTVVQQTIVRDVFETNYERAKRTKADNHFFKSALALIALYMKESKWSESEIVTKRSLELTWSAVLTANATLTLTGHHVSECIAIATQLAVCYHNQRNFAKAEEMYLRIYHACLQSFKVDDIRTTEAAMALIRFYEEYHRHEKVLEIYTELLTAYRQHLGATHKLVIQTLYALGSICMTLDRRDAYEYYIQIVTVLNKGTHCDHDAFEAALIVSRFYYEEKRWEELQKICAVLWETFVHHHKEFTFTEDMVSTLYERYVYALEYHAKVEFSVLYKLSVQYRETVTKYFGASAAIAVTAMIALAQICEKNEKHHQESVNLYEEVIKKITTITTTTTTTTVVETITQTVKKRLSKMYVTVITTGQNTSTATVARAIAVSLEIFAQLKLEFGCWHEKTLTHLKDLVILYKKIDSQESHASIIQLLQINVIEILSKVTTSITLYEAAVSMASIYVSVNMIQQGQELLHQLHHLIVLHDIGSTEHIKFKLDVKISKVMFVFLAAFELRLTKTVLTYTEIMAGILLETFMYEQYKEAIKTQTKVETLLEYGAKLRCFWEARGYKSHIDIIDKKLFEIFRTKFAHMTKTHEDITFIFYVGLLQELGKDHATVDFGHLVCLVSNTSVKTLLETGDFQRAHEVARCAFQIISAHGYYKTIRNIGCGYKLAEYMAGIDIRKPADNKIREAMLETSRVIVAEVLASCRAAKISFVSLKFEDIAGLVRLLGDQQYYSELEALLEALWQSREVQHTWSSGIVLAIGRLLVHARYAAGHVSPAIDLCDTVCYNLRRSRGYLDHDAVEASRLLASLLSATGRHRAALAVDEEVLRELDEDGDSGRADVASQQLELFRRRYARAGTWHTSEKAMSELVGRVRKFGGPAANVPSVEHWHNTKPSDSVGSYAVPREWRLESTKRHEDATKKRSTLTKWALRRSMGKNEEELKAF